MIFVLHLKSSLRRRFPSPRGTFFGSVWCSMMLLVLLDLSSPWTRPCDPLSNTAIRCMWCARALLAVTGMDGCDFFFLCVGAASQRTGNKDTVREEVRLPFVKQPCCFVALLLQCHLVRLYWNIVMNKAFHSSPTNRYPQMLHTGPLYAQASPIERT